MAPRPRPKLALFTTTLFVAFLATHSLAMQDQSDAPPAPVAAEHRDLVAGFRVTGRYEATVHQQLMYEPRAGSGKLRLVEVIEPGTRVSSGEVVMRLDAEGLDEKLEDAAFAVDQARRRLDWARLERELLAGDQEIALRRAELGLSDAELDWKLWEDVNKADKFLGAELDLARSEAFLEDEREELRQLEELYKGARLANQTQDIVLGRARRSLDRREQLVQIERRQYQQTIEVTLPRYERDLQNALTWQRVQGEIAEARMRLQMEKQEAEIDAARRGLDSAQRQLVRLQDDVESLVIKARSEGIVAGVAAEPGDNVQANQSLGQLIAAEPTTVTLSASAVDLRVLSVGDKVTVRCVAFGELSAAGRVTRIEMLGTPGAAAGGASFAVQVELERSDPRIRPGMAAVVTSNPTVEDALVVPVSAVKSDDQGSYVTLVTPDGPVRQDVLVGVANQTHIQIVYGLEPGDRVQP
ncbi:MAG: HlyD family efflux transporter periplasmic adaptor subunit [Planctomycetota bacterium]